MSVWNWCTGDGAIHFNTNDDPLAAAGSGYWPVCQRQIGHMWMLAETGAHCPTETQLIDNEELCEEIGFSMGAIYRNGEQYGAISGEWNWVPPHCSIQNAITGDGAIHWNGKSSGHNDGGYNPICERNEYYFVTRGLNDCSEIDGGGATEVDNEAECEIAGLSLGGHFENGESLSSVYRKSPPKYCSIGGGSLDDMGEITFNTRIEDSNNNGWYYKVCARSST